MPYNTATLHFEIEDTETTVLVEFEFHPGHAAHCDEYGRPTECGTADDFEIIDIKMIEGELAPTDEEIIEQLEQEEIEVDDYDPRDEPEYYEDLNVC